MSRVTLNSPPGAGSNTISGILYKLLKAPCPFARAPSSIVLLSPSLSALCRGVLERQAAASKGATPGDLSLATFAAKPHISFALT